MSYGLMGQLLRVDLADHKITVEETNQVWAEQYLGGFWTGDKILL